MQLSLLDIVLSMSYLGILMVLGATLVYRNLSPEHFMFGKKKCSGGLLGVLFASKSVSNLTFIAMIACGFEGGLWGLAQVCTLPFVGFFAGRWCVRFIRESGEFTAYNFLGKKLGKWATTYGSICYSLMALMRSGISIFLIMQVLSFGWGDPALVLCVIVGVMVTFFVYLGGIDGVLWTSVYQTVLKFLGLVVVAIYLLLHLKTGLSWSVVNNVNIEVQSSGLHWLYALLVFAWMMDMFTFGFSQSSAQLYLYASSEREAKKGMWIGLFLMGVILCLLWSIGYLTYAYMDQQSHMVILLARDGADVFNLLMTEVLPNGIRGLLLISFLSMGMGIVAIDLISVSNLFYNNFYRVYVRQKPFSEPKMIPVHKGSLIIATSMLFVAVLFYLWDPIDYLLIWWNISAVLVSAILGLFLLAFSKKSNSIGAIAGIFAGFLMAVAWMMLGLAYETFVMPLRESVIFLLLPVSVAAIVIVGGLVSFIASKLKWHNHNTVSIVEKS